MIENKKKLRQQRNLRQVFELCGSLRLPCHVALSPDGSGHITTDKRFGSCRASPKLPTLRFGNFVYPQTLCKIARSAFRDGSLFAQCGAASPCCASSLAFTSFRLTTIAQLRYILNVCRSASLPSSHFGYTAPHYMKLPYASLSEHLYKIII